MLNSIQVKAAARDVGFDLCGITSATTIPEAQERLTDWIGSQMHGEMSYMSRDPERRAQPERVLPGVRSLILLGLNYYRPNSKAPEVPNLSYGHVSRYARGKDYHAVIEEKHLKLTDQLFPNSENENGNKSILFRSYVDYGPILERSQALRADLGYLGKNSMLINKRFGSYFFLSAILTTFELEPDPPGKINHGRCGECRRCMDACPTSAIVADGVVDARRCISYLTIERPTTISDELAEKIGENLFGCDICQEVCPHNGRAVVSSHSEFLPEHGTGEWLSLESLDSLATEDAFKAKFAGTPILRTKLAGLQRNAVIVSRNLKNKQA